jgi:hypothetical protein
MRLAKPDDVLISMGVTSNAGSLASAGRALDSITPTIENMLETPLGESSRTDYFTPMSGSRTFLLSCMFIDPDSFSVMEASTNDPLLLSTDGVLVDPSRYFLEADKGRITFRDALSTAQHSLSATYDAGLAVDSQTKVAKDVPDWLNEVAIAAAVLSQNVMPSAQANRKEKNVIGAARAISSLLYRTLAPHFRPRLGVDFPVRTVTYD